MANADMAKATASLVLGSLPQFDTEVEDWDKYVKRVKGFLAVNDIAESKHVGLLLSAIGARAYSLLDDLCSPDDPYSKTFDEVVELLSEHLQPKPLEVSERYRFNQCVQGAHETVADFLATLRRLSKYCEFGTTLDKMLRDRFIVGLRSEAMRKRLLGERDLTLDKSVEIAKGMELAAKDAAAIGPSQSTSSSQLHVLRQKSKSSFSQKPAHVSSSCFRCHGSSHQAESCPFLNAECHSCHKKGHIAKACRSKKNSSGSGPPPHRTGKGPRLGKSKANAVEADSEHVFAMRERNGTHPPQGYAAATAPERRKFKELRPKDPLGADTLGEVEVETVEPKMHIDVQVNGHPMQFEFDTGASVTIVSKADIPFPLRLKRTQRKLRSASGHLLRLRGEAIVTVKYGSFKKAMKLYVAHDNCPRLFGRSWLRAIFGDKWLENLKAGSVNKVEAPLPESVKQIVDKYEDTFFRPGLGLVSGYTAHLELKEDAAPRFYKPRPVPYALQQKVADTLQRMESDGQLEKVSHSDWGTPIVPVIKPDQTIRICGDYKVTVNPQLALARHPMPRAEDCFRQMNGSKHFTTIDLSQAYNQIPLDDKSKELTTLSTNKGLYRWTRLPFGVSSAPGIFQETMDKVLSGLECTVCYLDDIMVGGATEVDHCRNLEAVLLRLSEHGFRGRRDKCHFFKDQVTYLGHVIDQHGVHVNPKKVKSIVNMPEPKNVSELSTFLGMATYYGKYIKDYSTMTAPLNKLRQQDVPWTWGPDQNKAFQAVKAALVSSDVLIHYDPHLELKLDCDASAVGLGAVFVAQDAQRRWTAN